MYAYEPFPCSDNDSDQSPISVSLSKIRFNQRPFMVHHKKIFFPQFCLMPKVSCNLPNILVLPFKVDSSPFPEIGIVTGGIFSRGIHHKRVFQFSCLNFSVTPETMERKFRNRHNLTLIDFLFS